MNTSFWSGLGEFIGQAGKTAVDVIAAKNSGVTSTSAPSVDPAALAAQAAAQKQQNNITPNYTPWIIGGIAAVAGLALVITLTRK